MKKWEKAFELAHCVARNVWNVAREFVRDVFMLGQGADQIQRIATDATRNRSDDLIHDDSHTVHGGSSLRYDYVVDIQPLSIAGAWRITPRIFGDDRGFFAEWFRADHISDATGYSFVPVQGNISRSSKGVVRGIHYADVPPGQAKYVMPVMGSIIDYIVDIRVGSPTFGQWDSVTLTSDSREAVIVEPGLGHAFVSLEDNTVVTYLVTDVFRPDREHGLNPLDPEIGLIFPDGIEPILSDKDVSAPSLAEALRTSALPKWGHA